VDFPNDFPITKTWPPRHPDRIQLYSINSPNGVKASVMLEETGLPYEPHLVRFDQKQQLSAEFRSLKRGSRRAHGSWATSSRSQTSARSR
jgi:GSH-dependent disulfide-bond oxidoreductase